MWTIRQMSEMMGIPMDSLRYYDKLGIVSPKRGENGYRYYTERDHVLLQYIAVMKYARFSLGEIKQVIRSFEMEPSEECNRLNYVLLESKCEELAGVVRKYKEIIKLFDKLLPLMDSIEAYCSHEKDVDAFVHDVYKSIRE